MKQQGSEQIASPKRVKFIEAKQLDMKLVADLLDECRQVNQWANFGPLYDRLADEYSAHMNLGAGVGLTPCANAGVALEALARVVALEDGKKKLRWIGSAFSFKNLGRGYFSDMGFVDCDEQGVLSLPELEQIPLDSFDGIIVTNPFGMCTDFDRFIRFAEANGKKLLIDNAAGISRNTPPWPWQVFSLHHTKPYGIGEGGMALSPDSTAASLRLLINYDKVPADASYWLNNGKISDISCAFLIARLRMTEHWEAGYIEQRQRILDLFGTFGLSSLLPVEGTPPTNCLPILLGAPVDVQKLARPRIIDIARQYEPLVPTPRAQDIFVQLINFPTHPDLRHLSDAQIAADIGKILECRIDQDRSGKTGGHRAKR